MSKRLKNYLSYYVVLLLVLSAVGVYNQSLFRKQWRIIDEKEALREYLVELNALEGQYLNPASVREWAIARGMVPTPEGKAPKTVIVMPAPEVSLPVAKNRLELNTVW